ncbi:MAG: hypothetical protein R3240_03030 [Gammaproteobacteria bacterium]|nr:hypothetical protein [Gammaproteobacteria bacterium]
MKNNVKTEKSTGGITTWNQVIRIALGMAIIVYSLNRAIALDVALVPEFFIGVLVVLSGIAKWDPYLAVERRIKQFAARSYHQHNSHHAV